MSEPFVGEIRMFAGTFNPRGWAFCDGQLLAINQNDALFSLLGTIYGGDGRTTFGLPDLRGRIPIHAGQGLGLPDYNQGQKSGQERVTLTVAELPAHAHASASSTTATEDSPEGKLLGNTSSTFIYRGGDPGEFAMQAGSIGDAGSSQSHTNLMPFLCVNFIIALFGIYPSRQ